MLLTGMEGTMWLLVIKPLLPPTRCFHLPKWVGSNVMCLKIIIPPTTRLWYLSRRLRSPPSRLTSVELPEKLRPVEKPEPQERARLSRLWYGVVVSLMVLHYLQPSPLAITPWWVMTYHCYAPPSRVGGEITKGVDTSMPFVKGICLVCKTDLMKEIALFQSHPTFYNLGRVGHNNDSCITTLTHW